MRSLPIVPAFLGLTLLIPDSAESTRPAPGAVLWHTENTSPPTLSNFDSYGTGLDFLGDGGFLVAVSGDDLWGPGPTPSVVLNAGSVYRCSAAGTCTLIPNPAPVVNDFFGTGLAGRDVAIDTDGDGDLDPAYWVSAPFADVGGNNSGVAYLYAVGGTQPVLTIANPDPGPGDQFGQFIAAYGDFVVLTSLFGERATDAETLNSGIAHAYRVAWSPALNRLVANSAGNYNNPTPNANDNFGAAVAIVPDASATGGFSGVVIGSVNEDLANVTNSGAAFIFEPGGTLRCALPRPAGQPAYAVAVNDFHAGSVAVLGSGASAQVLTACLNCDGSQSIFNSGVVFRHNLSCGYLGAVEAPTPESAAGFSLQIAADETTAIIGERLRDITQGGTFYFNAGRAYTLDASGGVTHTVDNPTLNQDDQYGQGVAVSDGSGGDFAILAGSFRDRDALGAPDAGTVYRTVFPSGGSPTTTAYPNPDAPAILDDTADAFGTTVTAVAGEGGDPDLIYTGVPALDPPNPTVPGTYQRNAGGVAVLDAATGDLLTLFAPPRVEDEQRYGVAVTSFGPDDGPELSDLMAVTAMLGDSGGVTNVGIVYIVDRWSGEPVGDPIEDDFPEIGDNFGFSLAHTVIGDLSEPCSALVVVGEMGADLPGAGNTGRVWTYDAFTRESCNLFDNPEPDDADQIGFVVAADGRRIVTAARQDSVNGIGVAGEAYVFDAVTGELTCTIPNPMPQEGAAFGQHLAIGGGTLFVNAPFADEPGVADSGLVYAYHLSHCDDPDHGLRYTLHNPAPAAGDTFGLNFAALGNTVAVGVPGDDPPTNGAGSVEVFWHGEHLLTIVNPEQDNIDGFGRWIGLLGQDIAVGVPTDASTDAGEIWLFRGGQGPQ